MRTIFSGGNSLSLRWRGIIESWLFVRNHRLVVSIAAVLGLKSRHDGYIEGGEYIVSWCFGHLAGLASAEVYDERYLEMAVR